MSAPPVRPVDELLSPRAREAFVRRGGGRIAEHHASNEELRALLARHGLDAAEQAFDFECRFGGLTLARPEPAMSFGIGAMLRAAQGAWGRSEPRPGWPIASLYDGRMFLLPDGGIQLDASALGKQLRLGDSFLVYLERLLCGSRAEALPLQLTTPSLVGERIARSRALPPVPELSDSVVRVWEDGQLAVEEDLRAAPRTIVAGRSAARVAAVLQELLREDAALVFDADDEVLDAAR